MNGGTQGEFLCLKNGHPMHTNIDENNDKAIHTTTYQHKRKPNQK